jgi:hypothetical protein
MLKWCISLVIFSAALMTYAQKVTIDSTRNRFVPSGIRIGTDLITLGKSQFRDNFNGWEINADVDFNRYYLAMDYGSWANTLTLKNGDYQNDGRYWRVGIDVNFLLKDPDRNMFFLGFRYAGTTFNESLQFQFDDPTFGTITSTLNNVDRKARWGELVSGLRVKIWKELWMGYTGRLKFAASQQGPQTFDTYDIPGYGRLSKDVYWGFNYQIFWRFAWRKNLGPIRAKE